jgi:hypothetical protein
VSAYLILDTVFEINCDDLIVAAELSRLLAVFAGHDPPVQRKSVRITVRRASRGLRVVHAGHTDAPGLDHDLDPDAAIGQVIGIVNRTALALARAYAMHAGVVAAPRGALAFPGPSGSGKSTLVAACLRRGLAYVSDEALCVSPQTGLVQPYPRPLALDPWSARAVGLQPIADERYVTADELGATIQVEPLPLADCVLLNRRHGAASLGQLSRNDLLATLLRRSFTGWRAPEAAFDLVRQLVGGCGSWRLSYSDPAEAAQLIVDRLG